MQLRLLTNAYERQLFARGLAQARSNRDAGFTETPKSRLAAAHLAFGNLYGLFEHADDPTERMIAGLATHDLETLPQSYSKPDLSHLPPGSVIECGELWAASKGGGLLARRGILIVWKLSGVRAVLAYAVVRPSDRSKSFEESYLERVGDLVEYPYLRALDGSPVWVQPMVLWEEGLRKLFDERVGSARFDISEDLTRVRFANPLPFRPSLDRPAFALDAPAAAHSTASNPQSAESAESALC